MKNEFFLRCAILLSILSCLVAAQPSFADQVSVESEEFRRFEKSVRDIAALSGFSELNERIGELRAQVDVTYEDLVLFMTAFETGVEQAVGTNETLDETLATLITEVFDSVNLLFPEPIEPTYIGAAAAAAAAGAENAMAQVRSSPSLVMCSKAFDTMHPGTVKVPRSLPQLPVHLVVPGAAARSRSVRTPRFIPSPRVSGFMHRSVSYSVLQ